MEPFPSRGLGLEPWQDERLHAVANMARELDERPAWLEHAHAALDRAVWAAYGWDDAEPAAVANDVILTRRLELNQARIMDTGKGAPG